MPGRKKPGSSVKKPKTYEALRDQQIPMEKAFSSPYVLKQRLGHDLDARELAEMDPDVLTELFARPPALHRFPRANAKQAHEMYQVPVAKYDGDAARVWTDATTGAELVARVSELPGFGKQKSQSPRIRTSPESRRQERRLTTRSVRWATATVRSFTTSS